MMLLFIGTHPVTTTLNVHSRDLSLSHLAIPVCVYAKTRRGRLGALQGLGGEPGRALLGRALLGAQENS